MLMTCCYTSLSSLMYPMLKFSETSTASFSGLRRTCCLSTSCSLISIIPHSRHSLSTTNPFNNYVQHYKYLRVTVSHNLSWTQHIHDICKKARRKVLCTIYHRITKNTNNSRTFLGLVCPHLEYAAQVWNSDLEKDILESTTTCTTDVCQRLPCNIMTIC